MDLHRTLEWAAARKHGVLITIRRDGRPQSSDVVFAVDGDVIRISLTNDRAKTVNMRRDPRVVMHITEPGSWSYASIDGVVELSPVTTDPNDSTAEELVELYRAVSGEEHPDWDEYRQAMINEGRLVARLHGKSAVGQIH